MTSMRPPDPKPPLVLRQPPPPSRPHHGPVETTHLLSKIKNEEHNKTENRSNRTRPFLFRSCKTKLITTRTTNIVSLPDEMIFEILARVPAQDIYNAIRLVCRNWYKIIHTHEFIQAHLHHHQSQSGFLARNSKLELSFLAISTEKGSSRPTTEISKLNCIITEGVMSSCNGLVLREVDRNPFCITNPVTRQNFALPPILETTPAVRCGYAIAYAAASMEYKVVRPLVESQAVAILTVGVDKDWTRRVDTQDLTPKAKELFLYQRPLATDGFVHWAENVVYWCIPRKRFVRMKRCEYVLTLNVETEVITKFAIPRSLCTPKSDDYYYLPMGNYLSLLVWRSQFLWEFWEMKPETGEWAKLPKIDLKAQFAGERDCVPTPAGWLKSREVLVFSLEKEYHGVPRPTPYFVTFNVLTGEIHKFKLEGGKQHFVVHTNSLVWMG